MLQSAQQLSVAQQQQKDDSNYDYNNQLRAGIFEAYSGIFHAMGSSGNQYLQEAAKVGKPACVCCLLPTVSLTKMLHLGMQDSRQAPRHGMRAVVGRFIRT